MIAHHVGHQVSGISADVEELNPLAEHQIAKRLVSSDPDTVPDFLQAMREWYERLNVSARANDEHDNGEGRHVLRVLRVGAEDGQADCRR